MLLALITLALVALVLAAPLALRAHVPLGVSPPRPGDCLAVALDPALAAVLASPRRAAVPVGG